MANRSTLFWTGLGLYVVSFALVAVVDSPLVGNLRGWYCAYVSLLNPITDADTLRTHSPSNIIEYIAIGVSGLINPLFLLWIFKRWKRLRIALLSMMPFCWVVFYIDRQHPREGYFLWTLGMLLVLFSDRRRSPQLQPRHTIQ